MLIFLLGGKPSDPFTILTYWSNSYLWSSLYVLWKNLTKILINFSCSASKSCCFWTFWTSSKLDVVYKFFGSLDKLKWAILKYNRMEVQSTFNIQLHSFLLLYLQLSLICLRIFVVHFSSNNVNDQREGNRQKLMLWLILGEPLMTNILSYGSNRWRGGFYRIVLLSVHCFLIIVVFFIGRVWIVIFAGEDNWLSLAMHQGFIKLLWSIWLECQRYYAQQEPSVQVFCNMYIVCVLLVYPIKKFPCISIQPCAKLLAYLDVHLHAYILYNIVLCCY